MKKFKVTIELKLNCKNAGAFLDVAWYIFKCDVNFLCREVFEGFQP